MAHHARSMEVLNQDCWHARHMAMDHVTTITCEKKHGMNMKITTINFLV